MELGNLLRQLFVGPIGRARVRVSVTVRILGKCTYVSPNVKVALYRVSQEALNNVAKHTKAGQGTVSLVCGPDAIKLQIGDNGRGFDLDEISPILVGCG